MMHPDRLQPGDVLLYRPSSLFGWAIRIKSGSAISHVEVYADEGFSVASRDGKGVARYPLRPEQLSVILRPTEPFYLAPALAWFKQHEGEPYGWLDLLDFFSLNVNGPGMVCSPFVTEFLRAGGIPVFGTFPAIRVFPRDFLTSEYLKDVTELVVRDLPVDPVQPVSTRVDTAQPVPAPAPAA